MKIFALFAFLLVNLTFPVYGVQNNAEYYFDMGYQAYEEDNYEYAIESLEKAVEMDKNQSKYFHMLGKSYGKLANESNWFKAIDLSQKTLQALEIAVELDPHYRQAKIDLIKFYRQAPSFLGGDNKKADALELQLKNQLNPDDVADSHPQQTLP